jgi:hypothetical protein
MSGRGRPPSPRLAARMPTFLYIDYGPSPYIGRELRYSLSTLLAEYPGGDAQILVYTDKPKTYDGLHDRVRARDISGDIGAMTRHGELPHRIKACVLLDALTSGDDDCVLLDTDSYIMPGFAGALAGALAAGAAMDAFEEYDPYPELAGFRADLPHAGRYAYDPVHSVMYNSGLVAARPTRDAAAIEDAITLIDAMLDAGNRSFKIEQISFSESFRLHEAPVAEMRPLFQHYFRRSTKRYMHWRIDRWMRHSPHLEVGRPFIKHSRNVVRVFNYINQLTKKY